MYFYDTCALLEDADAAFLDQFIITNITLLELEDIKTSKSKDDEVKAKARAVIRLLQKNKDKYIIYPYSEEYYAALDQNVYLPNNDSKIIATALKAKEEYENLIFKTYDLSCSFLAAAAGLKIDNKQRELPPYHGFKILNYKSENETLNFYTNIPYCPIEMNNNEYLFIAVNGEVIDKYKYVGGKLKPLIFPCFESKQLGKIKPKDDYQFIAMDCLRSNQLCLLRGPAGSGKSYLAMAYLFDQLEKGKISKIIIFCNTVATLGSAKLGYYPGSKDEKLLDSQIGNFLVSKLGGKEEVQKKIDEDVITLLPMSDIRGYDTTGMNAGIYITEAQNLDIELMRLALQRVGEDSICIIEGDDSTQVDSLLYAGARNGIRKVSETFRGQTFFGEVTLQTIHRSRIAEIAQKM